MGLHMDYDDAMGHIFSYRNHIMHLEKYPEVLILNGIPYFLDSS
jgi:hypothetical protein